MEAKVSQSMQFLTWIDSGKISRKPSGSLGFSWAHREEKRHQMLSSGHLQPRKTSTWHRPVAWEDSRSHTKFPGMMGSGKTTVGKILSEVLGYSFVDSDILVEQAVGETSVAEIFKLYGEGFFRDKETEVLQKLSLMHRKVVSTGGGAVVRPINWKYMQKGISVWIDVPLEALAQRIVDVGTHSRPLLHNESGDAYSKTFMRLSTLLEERSEAYANANARVSLENIAAKLGYRDAFNLTPTLIAIEALEQIGNLLKGEDDMAIAEF